MKRLPLVVVAAATLLAGCWPFGLHESKLEREQKKAYQEGLVADHVWCEACKATSKLDVPFWQRRTFQVCPACGEERARPVVYWYCMGKNCNKQLVPFINHVWTEDGFSQSPQGAPVCPKCGEARNVSPEELHLAGAREIAKETNQPFPPEGGDEEAPPSETTDSPDADDSE